MVSLFRQPSTLALLSLGLGGLLIWSRPPASGAAKPLPPLPQVVGGWQGTAEPVDARSLAILETDDVVVMTYRRDAEPPVWVSRVAGFGGRAAYHPPELCLVGSDFEILEREAMGVEAGGSTRRVVRLLFSKGAERFESWYWFTAGGRMTPSYLTQQLWLFINGVLRRPLSGTLVRISTRGDDPEETKLRLSHFLDSFYGTL